MVFLELNRRLMLPTAEIKFAAQNNQSDRRERPSGRFRCDGDIAQLKGVDQRVTAAIAIKINFLRRRVRREGARWQIAQDSLG